MTIVDLVYPVKFTDDLEELRYSLRSIHAHAQGLYGRVWIATREGLPSWLTGVHRLDAGDGGGKTHDIRSKIAAACANREVSQTFLLMCDDFYLVEPVTEWAAFHMGPTSEYVQRLLARTDTARGWLRCVTDTADWMAEQGYGDILARQGHRPLLWDKTRLADALNAYPTDRKLDVNGLYDIAGAGGIGTRGMNSKVRMDDAEFHEKTTNRDIPWLSSNNGSFTHGLIGEHIRDMFPDPSPFERS